MAECVTCGETGNWKRVIEHCKNINDDIYFRGVKEPKHYYKLKDFEMDWADEYLRSKN